MSELFSGPDSEYHDLRGSTVAQQIIDSCTIEDCLKKEALYDISKMMADESYKTLVGYRNDAFIGDAFNWYASEKGPEFWQIIFEQLNGM